MKIKIVTDSASNMTSLEGIDFQSVPLKIITDDKEYVDDINLDVEGMVNDLSTYKGRSGTACPGVGDWLDAFEGYDIIFCVTIISTLSGSYNAAMTAKQQYEEENPGKIEYKYLTEENSDFTSKITSLEDSIRVLNEQIAELQAKEKEASKKNGKKSS